MTTQTIDHNLAALEAMLTKNTAAVNLSGRRRIPESRGSTTVRSGYPRGASTVRAQGSPGRKLELQDCAPEPVEPPICVSVKEAAENHL